MASLSRRRLLAAAPALAVAMAVPAVASESVADARWRELHEGFAGWNLAVAAALVQARAAGMNPDHLDGVHFPIRASAFVTFYWFDDTEELRSFDAHGERGWHT